MDARISYISKRSLQLRALRSRVITVHLLPYPRVKELDLEPPPLMQAVSLDTICLLIKALRLGINKRKIV